MVSLEYDEKFPLISRKEDFDDKSGGFVERLIFNNRVLILLVCLVATVVLAYQASRLGVNASFEKMIPGSHPYILNYKQNRDDLQGLGNTLRIVVEHKNGDIYGPEFFDVFRKVNDALYLTPGIDRARMKSILMASARWNMVTEDGYQGGPIMPARFDNPEVAFKQLRINVERARVLGSLVGNDQRSVMIVATLLDRDPQTGASIDYNTLAKAIDSQVRSLETEGVKIRVVGFAQLVGDLITGLSQVAVFFAFSVLLAMSIIFVYMRCLRSALLLVSTSLLGVLWLLGIMHLLGFSLDPYSVLVPFLIFAIGLSHGAQKMNGIMQDEGRGMHRYVAARYTFRRLFMTGFTALLANLVGFSVFVMIDIPIIKEMAIITSLGVTVLIFTKLMLIPVLLSYVGVSRKAALRSIEMQDRLEHAPDTWIAHAIERLTSRSVALALVLVSVGLGCIAAWVSLTQLKTGDLDPGAPELRADSRYNRDVAYIGQAYGQSSEQFAVIVKSPPGECDRHDNLVDADRLAWTLEGVEGVLAVDSYVGRVRKFLVGANEGSPKWDSILRNEQALGSASYRTVQENPDMVSRDCSVYPLVAYLTDHKAETLDRVLAAVEIFAATHNRPGLSFLPAAGAGGIEAITNIVVREAQYPMLLALYAAVTLLCLLTFRSWRATLVALIPLVITSFLCEALMVAMDIGIKVSTLPVIALGVGVGVDYALYLLSVQITLQRRGVPLAQAYRASIAFTGRMVLLVALTMAAAVFTWAWSPIKFQADMGVLLTFMFLWNMVGAMVLVPALSRFLLPDGALVRKAVASPVAPAGAVA